MKKNLLQETELKKMMKLAGVSRSLTENFVRERYYEEEDMMSEMPEDDMEPPMDMDEPEGGEDAGGLDVEELVMAIADAITSTTGVDVEVEGGEGAPEPEMDMGPEEPEMGMDDEEEPLEEGDSSHEMSAGMPNQAAQGKTKPGSFEGAHGSHIAQLEEGDVDERMQRGRHPHDDNRPDRVAEGDELEEGEELEEYGGMKPDASFATINQKGPAGSKPKRKHKKDARRPVKKPKGPRYEGEELEEGDELEEAEMMGGSDPNKFPKHMQKEHMKAMAKEVARNVVASLLEQIQAKKK